MFLCNKFETSCNKENQEDINDPNRFVLHFRLQSVQSLLLYAPDKLHCVNISILQRMFNLNYSSKKNIYIDFYLSSLYFDEEYRINFSCR